MSAGLFLNLNPEIDKVACFFSATGQRAILYNLLKRKRMDPQQGPVRQPVLHLLILLWAHLFGGGSRVCAPAHRRRRGALGKLTDIRSERNGGEELMPLHKKYTAPMFVDTHRA